MTAGRRLRIAIMAISATALLTGVSRPGRRHHERAGPGHPERAAADPAAAGKNATGQQTPSLDDKVSYKFSPGGFSLGDARAPLVMVEYTDFQCPFCQQFHNTAFAQIKANYIDTGKLRFVSRDFPLDFHENARRAATAGRCAAEQGKFWEMRQVMIANAEQLRPDNPITYAANVKLDVPKFKSCLESDRFKAQIDQDIAEGEIAGVQGTPSFVIGRIENDKLEGVRLVGEQPYAQFDARIQELLDPAAKVGGTYMRVMYR